MRPIQKTINLQAASANGLVTSVTPVDGVNLTLSGSLTSGGVGTFVYPTTVSFTSTSNLSTVTFTVEGTGATVNSAGSSFISESVTGPNNTTVYTTKTFVTVTKISVATSSTFSTEKVVSGGAAVGVATGAWWPLDIYNPNQVTTISCNIISGSATYTVEYTNEDPFDTTITQLAQAHPAAALTGASTSQTAFTTTLMRAVRVNTASGSGQLRVTVTQQSTV